MQTLAMKTPPVFLCSSESETVARETVDGWEVVESYVPDVEYFNQKSFGVYAVSLSKEIPAEDVGSEYIAGCYLAHALNRAFIFATGKPLTRSGYGLFLKPINPPFNWTSNASEVLPEEDWAMLQAKSEWIPQFRILPRLPLADSLRALRAFAGADSILSQLIFYHGTGVTTVEPDLHLLLFAQALEIVRELLPGESAAAKQSKLPEPVRRMLRHEVNWLFGMAQQRRETRHSVDKQGQLRVKPSFDVDEEEDFLHDAELLVRAVICARLEIPIVYSSLRAGEDTTEVLVE